jgi:hydroxypyruvate reductase
VIGNKRRRSIPAITPLQQDLADILAAMTAAIDPCSLMGNRLSLGQPAGQLRCDDQPVLVAGGDAVDLDQLNRIVVVGGGKAAGGFAAGLEALLGPQRLAQHRVTGLVSVPEGCGLSLTNIEVRETRPGGVNLPTTAVGTATGEMLAMLSQLDSDDLAIVLITGGGSALLEAPVEGISLELLSRITQQLATAGADITAINTVRRAASRVKGGGLAAACSAGRLLAVVLSDVIGDDLGTIASGPCLPATIDIGGLATLLAHYGVLPADRETLLKAARRAAASRPPTSADSTGRWTTSAGCRVGHLLLGSNTTAVGAAATAAENCGYQVISAGTVTAAETANATGSRLASLSDKLVAASEQDGQPRAVIEGGEATVVVPVDHGRGGRNQQTVLAVARDVLAGGRNWPAGLLLASFGTDGEDGPTSAAGGFIDSPVAATFKHQPAALSHAIDRCDAHPLLATAGGLIETGPTGTNVADVRIMLIRPDGT